MAFKLGDLVFETTTTTGTGAYSLAGAQPNHFTFVARVGNGNTTIYSCEDGTNYEIGFGTVTDATPDTLSRDVIIRSSNGGAAVNWGPGTRNIISTISGAHLESLLDPAQASGIVCRTSTHVYDARQIVSSTPALAIANPAGIAGNPTLTLSLGNGLKDLASTLVAALPVSTISGAITVSSGHRGTLLDIASAVAVAIASAGVLGADHFFAIHNSAASAISVSAINQIDGASTLSLDPGTGTIFVCTGSTFRTIGGGAPKVKVSASDSGSGYLADKLVVADGLRTSTVNTGGALALQVNGRQIVATTNVANTDISAAIPVDDTPPLSSEGVALFNVTITLQNAANRVFVRFSGMASSGASTAHMIFALFRGTTCIATGDHRPDSASGPYPLVLNCIDAPGSVGPHTYTIRIGSDVGTIRLNGTTSARLYGGTSAATLIAEEIGT